MTENPSIDDVEKRIGWFDSNYGEIRSRIAGAAQRSGRRAEDINLLAATKTVPVEVINHAISSGITLIGENRVQELCEKYDALDKSAQRHHIGKLQTNKVKQVIDKVSMIESVDSVHLARVISEKCTEIGKIMDVLVEINIGDEPSKSGIHYSDTEKFLSEISDFQGIRVRGLMCIPPIVENDKKIRCYFDKMYELFIDISGKKIDNITMEFLSMGMSGDFEQAIESGANIVRVGSSLFGARNYSK